jgi:hypothetical protein
MFKFLRDGFIAVVMDASVRYFWPDVVPILPYAWLAILSWLTFDLIRWKPVRGLTERAYFRWGKNRMSYLCVFIIGGSLLCFYWWGINRALSTFHHLETKAAGAVVGEQKATIETASPVPKSPSPVPRHLAYTDMTNEQLRDATMKYVSRLRKFNDDFQTADRRIQDKEWNDSRSQSLALSPEEKTKPEVQARLSAEWNARTSRMIERRNKFQESFKSNFLVDAGLLEQELKKRTDPGALTGLGNFNEGEDTLRIGGMLAGVDPVGGVANYLEYLAKQLPADE